MSDPRSTVTDPSLLRLATEYVTALAFDRPPPEVSLAQPSMLAAMKEASGIQGLGPWLGLRVQVSEIAPPEPVASWLAGQVERNRERLTRMRVELLETLAALAERGFTVMPVKGGALLLESVEAMVWRPFADLDLLVTGAGERVQDLDLALARAGYCFDSASWKHRTYTSCAPRPPLVIGDGEHPDNPRDVEIHNSVVEMFRGFTWDLTPYLRAEPSEIGGWHVPSDRAMALHLAVHASISALEGTARAINLIDLARAVKIVGPMPVYLATRDAGLNQHARFVYPAVAFTARETGDPASEQLRQMLAPFVPVGMVDWAERVSLYHISWAGRHDHPALDRHRLWARNRGDRARMLAHTLLPAPSVLASEQRADTGPLAIMRGYGRHYRRLSRRLR